jgi:hypothetical protein
LQKRLALNFLQNEMEPLQPSTPAKVVSLHNHAVFRVFLSLKLPTLECPRFHNEALNVSMELAFLSTTKEIV